MKKSFLLIALTVVAFFGSCSGGNGDKESAAGNDVDEKPKVKLAYVTVRPVAQIQEYTATVEAEIKNHIAPSIPVRISKILVEVGDRVSKGQKLVEMDDTNFRQSKLQLENQQKEFNRIDELYKVGGVSKSDWDAMRTALDVTETTCRNLSENTLLQSPISGIITARNFDNGDMFSGGVPVLTVEQMIPVKLIISVPESYFIKVYKGAAASVTLDVYGEEVFNGKVSLIYPTVNPATRTFQVEITLDNRDLRVRPGMFARVMLNYGTLNRVVVPDLAIVKQAGSGDRYIFVYRNGQVSYNKVELGRRMGAEYELISGVPDNAQVVIAGQARLLNGTEVEVEQ
jgi:RND family efflux transporter MFP subunit